MREALGIKSDFSVDEELQITSGHIGLWDTHAEDMERTMIIKQLQEAAEQRMLFNTSMTGRQSNLMTAQSPTGRYSSQMANER